MTSPNIGLAYTVQHLYLFNFSVFLYMHIYKTGFIPFRAIRMNRPIFSYFLSSASVLGVTFNSKGIYGDLHGVWNMRKRSHIWSTVNHSDNFAFHSSLSSSSIVKEARKDARVGGKSFFRTVTLMKVQISVCDFESLSTIHLQMCVSDASTLAFQDVICLFILRLSCCVAR